MVELAGYSSSSKHGMCNRISRIPILAIKAKQEVMLSFEPVAVGLLERVDYILCAGLQLVLGLAYRRI
jgi:hypothetical protein